MMTPTDVSAITGRPRNDRKQEVKSRLAGLEVQRRIPGAASDDRARARLLAAALADLGPILASFGLYMSTRIDLVSGVICEELAGIPDRGSRCHGSYISDLLRRELGPDRHRLLSDFDETPFESRLVVQCHEARTEDGALVEVRLVRPEVRQTLVDLDLLHLTEACFGRSAALAAAMADFREEFSRRIDMRQEVRAYLQLAAVDGEEGFMVPPVIREPSSSNILVLERLAGTPARECLEGAGGRHVAHLLSQSWLQQALVCEVFPAEVRLHDLDLISIRRIGFRGSSIRTPQESARETLWRYLIAASAEDADGACGALLALVTPESRPADDQKIRQRLRQIVPFRDGTWAMGSNDLPGHIFAHWRTLREEGYVLQTDAVAFFRGLFCVAEIARSICPGYDAISDALRHVRMLSTVSQFGAAFDPRHFGEQSAGVAAAMLMMPQRMDGFLTGAEPLRVAIPGSDGPARRNNASAAVSSLAILMAAVVLLANRFLPQLLGASAADRVLAVLFVLLGALLLRAVSRI
jgi:hypothetical protein